ncbi:MAG: SRPBCC family protein [Flavobacteriales bacterium]|nr:SRPBCC family protein [Flavobacteriales bacterium]
MKLLKSILKWLFIAGITLLILAVVLSPYQHYPGETQRAIICSIEIDAPVETVFTYLGNSDHAKEWSVFVDHITPLNATSYPDGAVGSVRRAFCNPDESGMRWDELTTEVVPHELRRLDVYDFVDFPMTAEGLFTEQRYTSLPDGKTQLAFTLEFKESPSLWVQLKTSLGAHRIASIFDDNLENIKRLIEAENP